MTDQEKLDDTLSGDMEKAFAIGAQAGRALRDDLVKLARRAPGENLGVTEKRHPLPYGAGPGYIVIIDEASPLTAEQWGRLRETANEYRRRVLGEWPEEPGGGQNEV